MQLIDTHTHLYSEEFDQDRDTVVQNAIDKGIGKFVLPAIDSTYTYAMDRLVEKYPQNMFPMAGLHPTHVKADTISQELDHVAQRLARGSFYAVGEIGIDLYWDKSTLDLQKKAFKQQVQWAKKYNLPIVIHCREAFDEVFEVLEEERDPILHGIFHCFTGNLAQAERAIHLNLKLGIGGIVTFKNAGLDKVVGQIKPEHIVLETDAPYLAPAPFRGKRNESSYLSHIAQKVTEIYNLPAENIAEITTQNANLIFGLK